MSMQIRQFLTRAAETARLMVGVPDYARYVAHMRTHHPELPVADEAVWLRQIQEKRFGGKGGGRCPC